MSDSLSRLFAISRADREALRQVPALDAVLADVKRLLAAVATDVVDQYGLDPVLAEKIKAHIELEIEMAMPVDALVMRPAPIVLAAAPPLLESTAGPSWAPRIMPDPLLPLPSSPEKVQATDGS